MSNVIRVPQMMHRKAIADYEATCQRAAERLERTTLSTLDVIDMLGLRAEMEDFPCG